MTLRGGKQLEGQPKNVMVDTAAHKIVFVIPHEQDEYRRSE